MGGRGWMEQELYLAFIRVGEGFQPKSGKKFSNQGIFFKTIFKPFKVRENVFFKTVKPFSRSCQEIALNVAMFA